MERRLYVLVLSGRGERFGGPPISTIRVDPVSPGPARWYGGRVRSGGVSIVHDECTKLEERPEDMASASAGREGGWRLTLWTGSSSGAMTVEEERSLSDQSPSMGGVSVFEGSLEVLGQPRAKGVLGNLASCEQFHGTLSMPQTHPGATRSEATAALCST